ncbi:MAG: ATP-binding protein [Acidobacteria bacterium]|nr:ATP-binding protein [Acidobacteriota bacterium]
MTPGRLPHYTRQNTTIRSIEMQNRFPAARYALVPLIAFLLWTPSPVPLLAQAPDAFTPVTDAMLQSPDADDWLMWRRTLNGWGYSPLDQIDRDNVNDLRMVWTRGLTRGSNQGTPLVYDGVLYMPNPGDVIQAINAVTGDLQWEYQREQPDDLEDFVPGLGQINRNIAIHDTLIIDTSTDDYVFALDATSGRLEWETQILDYHTLPAHQSSGPIIANGKVISGRGCPPRSGPEACVITAHDATTGNELWRRRLIPAPGEPGDETWGDVPFAERRHVGAWMVPSYDPELNLVYVGTSVTSPAPKFLVGGVNNTHLYHNSTLALDANTGEIAWYYQHLNDHWDLDHPFERLLVDTAVTPNASAVSWINPRLRPGEQRRVVTGIPGKTGVVYTLDRETGEFLWATPTVSQNVISNIDGATGTVTENAEVIFTAEGQEVMACPTWHGGKDWEAGAYSPLTNTMFMPLRHTCGRMMASADGSWYALTVRTQLTPGEDQLGTIQAISVETGETRWTHDQEAFTMSLVTTGGGLVFGGDAAGRFKALDQETGEVLWEINLGSPVTGFPVTYAVDGHQYVAVSTGNSLNTGGLRHLTPDLRPSNSNNLFVFALPN